MTNRLRRQLEHWADKGAGLLIWLIDCGMQLIGYILLAVMALFLTWAIWFMYTAHRDCAAFGFTDVRLDSLKHEGIWCGKYIGDIHITMQLQNLEDGW